ncbi:MAG TPA: ABC transporter permease [Lachnospiraceae bacterium]|nr:ABC transporter permease [Lachnospiraceae bacterium]
MHERFFYPKLAFTGMLRNKRIFLPYLLSVIVMAGMFYVLMFISTDKMIGQMPGSSQLTMLLSFGCLLVGFFSFIIMLYTNSFVMKNRQKELGVYYILGMEKRHIAYLLFFEGIYMAIAGIAGGILAGILFSKLVLLFLLKLIKLPVVMGFSVSGAGIAATAFLFAVIFIFTLILNLARIGRMKPVELLHGGESGEREPKSKIFLTVVGTAALVSGYLIANLIEDPVAALVYFLLAVFLVIIGTELLFTSGSVSVLKMLRANKKYFYKPQHFTTVSGMLYRMKQNAVGLANICILCTMVLVAVSTTLSMYAGAEDSIREMFPHDVSIRILSGEGGEDTAKKIISMAQSDAAAEGQEILDLQSYDMLSFYGTLNGDSISAENYSGTETFTGRAVTAAAYEQMTGKKADLAENEVLNMGMNQKLPADFSFAGGQYKVKDRFDGMLFGGEWLSAAEKIQLFVVKDESVLSKWAEEVTKSDKSEMVGQETDITFNLSGDDKQQLAFGDSLENKTDDSLHYIYRTKAANKQDFYITYGGFLFLGIFLGILFLVVTAMIIYYKQVSEGYDDRKRFEIMQKVGMSMEEVKSTVKAQILTVFFLPLIVAGIHVFGAFHMISRMLLLFGISNLLLFAVCTLVTLGVFSLIYALVYWSTAKTYYNIVRRN